MAYPLEQYVRTVITSTAHRLTERLHPKDGRYQPTTEAAKEVHNLIWVAVLAFRDVVDHIDRVEYLQKHGKEAFEEAHPPPGHEEYEDLVDWRRPWETREERAERGEQAREHWDRLFGQLED